MKRLAACIAVALAACGQPEQTYTAEYELNFVRGCEAQGAPRQVCVCSWARVEAEVPRAELEALERMPAAQRPSSPVQQKLEDFARQCAAAYAEDGGGI